MPAKRLKLVVDLVSGEDGISIIDVALREELVIITIRVFEHLILRSYPWFVNQLSRFARVLGSAIIPVANQLGLPYFSMLDAREEALHR